MTEHVAKTVGANKHLMLLKWVCLFCIASFVLMPMVISVLGGFKTLGELRVNPFGLPSEWRFDVFHELLFSSRIWRLMLNSLFIAAISVFLTLLLGSMAAFVFAQIRFFGAKYIYAYVLAGMTFPVAAAVLPVFIKVRDLGLLDSHFGVILPQVAFGLGFSVMLFKTFFEQMPKELFEAAQMDGCGYIKFYWHFTLPLSLPILATIGVFTLVASWNNFLIPLVMLNDETMYPWPLGLMVFYGEYGIQWNRVLAFITITIIPAVIFFLMAQKYIVAGLTGGAVKG